jgi:hypothetical protein
MCSETPDAVFTTQLREIEPFFNCDFTEGEEKLFQPQEQVRDAYITRFNQSNNPKNELHDISLQTYLSPTPNLVENAMEQYIPSFEDVKLAYTTDRYKTRSGYETKHLKELAGYKRKTSYSSAISNVKSFE